MVEGQVGVHRAEREGALQGGEEGNHQGEEGTGHQQEDQGAGAQGARGVEATKIEEGPKHQHG